MLPAASLWAHLASSGALRRGLCSACMWAPTASANCGTTASSSAPGATSSSRGLHTSSSTTFNVHDPSERILDHALAAPNPLAPPAFSFDIDGVLIRGAQVLEPAKRAMEKLCPGGVWRYPAVFMTNGGGVTEATKAAQLQHLLGVPVSEDQIILSHTPMRSLAQRFGSLPVLLSGRGDIAHVAHSYGFQKVMTTQQLARAVPAALPFIKSHHLDDIDDASRGGGHGPSHSHHHAHSHKHQSHGSKAQQHSQAHSASSSGGASSSVTSSSGSGAGGANEQQGPGGLRVLGTEAAPFAAVMVFNDPSNWYVDMQLITDVLGSRGVPTRRGVAPGAPVVPLFFSNPDLLWANEHPRNRFGQGAFAVAVLALCRELGIEIPVKFFGKPNAEPYRMAETLLLRQAERMGLCAPQPPSSSSNGNSGSQQPRALPFSAIYGIGDNPAADVRGANAAGRPWVSVLVRTGVFQGPGANCTSDPAQVAVPDVAGAVDAALHRMRAARFFSMR